MDIIDTYYIRVDVIQAPDRKPWVRRNYSQLKNLREGQALRADYTFLRRAQVGLRNSYGWRTSVRKDKADPSMGILTVTSRP
jgi:hypothetical protein